MDNPYASPSLGKDAEPPVDRNHPAGFGFVTRVILLIVASAVLLYFAAMTTAWTYSWMTRARRPDLYEKAMYVGAVVGALGSGTTLLGGILNNRRVALVSALATIFAFAVIVFISEMR